MSENIKDIIGSIFSTAFKIVLGMIILMFIRKYALMAYNYGYRVFTEPPVTVTGDGTVISVSIGEEHNALEIGKTLESKGLIRDAKLFVLQELANENHGKIQPGKYDLNTNMTASEMISIMSGAEEEQTEEDLLFNEDEQTVPFSSDESLLIDEESDPESEDESYSPEEQTGESVEGEQ